MNATIVVCPQCGRATEVHPGEHPFCVQCDYPLFWVAPRPQPAQPVVIEPDPLPGVGCASCGAENAASRVLCERCGRPLREFRSRQRRTWEVAEEGPAEPRSRRRRVILRAALGVVAVVLVAAVIGAGAWYFWPRSTWQVTVLDQGESSWDVSAALRRGSPVISYVDAGDYTLRVVACGNPLCDGSTNPIVHTIVTSIGTRGQGFGTAVAVGVDGHPIIAFRNGDRRAMTVAHCGDPLCSDAGAITITEIDPGPDVDDLTVNVGIDPSIVIGADGLALIAYHDRTRGALKVAHCNDRPCTSATIAVLDRSPGAAGDPALPGVGMDTALAVGRDGLPIIAFRDGDDSALKVARCSDERCTQAVILTMVRAPGMDPAHDSALVLDPTGLPIVAYADWSDDGVYVARCENQNCSSVTVRRVDREEDGTSGDVSLVLDARGLPVVAYRQRLPGDERASRVLRVVRCEDIACERAQAPETVDDRGRTGYSPRLLLLNDGTLAIAYGDATQGALEYAVYR